MFLPETTLYPPASAFQQYLLDFTHHFSLRKFIRLKTRVEEAIWNGTEWAVRISGETEIQNCHHIILANGHYNKPYLPEYPGLKAWASQEGHSAIHSTYYRNPSNYTGKRVIIVGGRPSGKDISAEVSLVAREAFHSVKNWISDNTTNPKKRPEIASFDPDGPGTVRYVDGTEDKGIDAVIWATGFELE